MTNQTDLKDKLIKDFEIFEGGLNGEASSAVHQIRKQAIQNFNKLGFPTVKNEDWKYTNVSFLKKQAFQQILANGESSKNYDLSQFEIDGLDASKIVFVNGHYNAELSNVEEEKDGLVIGSLHKAFTYSPQLIDAHFSKYADIENEPFVALNTSFSIDGLFVHVPNNYVVEKPIYVIHLVDKTLGDTLTSPRNLIIAGENSQCKIIQRFVDLKEENASFTNAVTEIVAADKAIVDHYIVQDEHKTANNITETVVKIGKEARVDCHNYSLEGGLMRNKTNIVMHDEHCEGHLYGLYVLNNEQHADNRSLADHESPNCMSNELYKGILGDKAKGVFNGRIMVRRDAQKTNAYQTNRNILVSDDAQINSKPQLEIFADDVRCSHGCTTGQLDEEAIFYLRSRGLKEKQARTYLLQAFAGEVLEKITIEPLKAYLSTRIFDKINSMMQ